MLLKMIIPFDSMDEYYEAKDSIKESLKIFKEREKDVSVKIEEYPEDMILYVKLLRLKEEVN